MYLQEVERLGQTAISSSHVAAVISSIRKSSPIDIKDFLQNIPKYFDDQELINKFKNIQEEISDIKKYSAGFDDIEDTVEEDIVWETIDSCWNIVTKRLGFPIVTPWTLELTREDKNLTRFLGQSRNLLQVRITIGDLSKSTMDPEFDYDSLPTFVYDFTEELTLGILLGLEGNKNFNVYMEEVYEYTSGDHGDISLEELLPNFMESNAPKRKYTANIKQGIINFNTLDLIQGIITAASWLNHDPHNYIKDIRDNGVLITF